MTPQCDRVLIAAKQDATLEFGRDIVLGQHQLEVGQLELVDELAAARSELTWNIENYSTRLSQRYEVAEPIALPHTANIS